jgi:hypothetical protein
MTFAEGDPRPRVPAESSSISLEEDAGADKVPLPMADVELCMPHEAMSLMIEGGARRERSDRPVGE